MKQLMDNWWWYCMAAFSLGIGAYTVVFIHNMSLKEATFWEKFPFNCIEMLAFISAIWIIINKIKK
jgi:hypothetical protein